jgi:putative transposase
MEHGRRKILHLNVMEHPTAPWIVQQLKEAFRESCAYRYMILDRDAKFGTEVADLLAASGIKPICTSFACPWQNGIAERWVESCRRELLDRVIFFNDLHLRRLLKDYLSYDHSDRIHDSLGKDTPALRPVSAKPNPSASVVSFPRLGGLHHQYDWQQAA